MHSPLQVRSKTIKETVFILQHCYSWKERSQSFVPTLFSVRAINARWSSPSQTPPTTTASRSATDDDCEQTADDNYYKQICRLNLCKRLNVELEN